MIQSRDQNYETRSSTQDGDVRTWLTSPQISQNELQHLLELRECSKQQKELLRSIKKKYEQGCATEPGPLSLDVKECQSKSFSFDKVSSILGRDKAEELRDKIPVSISKHFKVISTQ